MTGAVPQRPKIYHIVHVDKLPSIVADGFLWCDAEVTRRQPPGTVIGMSNIKEARLTYRYLASHPDLLVGGCVPFYFCPRPVMLYLIWRANHPELAYRGGQEPIVHLEADLYDTVAWANANNRRWAFTLSNAASGYFEDRCDLNDLDDINWDAVKARQWSGQGISSLIKENKQAEFLIEHCFPWQLIERIGVISQFYSNRLRQLLGASSHQPPIQILREWYY